jgi:hypothetical protein
LSLLVRELHEKMRRFFRALFSCLEEDAEDIDVPDCLFLGATPQYDARWPLSGSQRRRRR